MLNSTLLEQSILLTIVYYDVLNKPLTAFEIWQYLMKPSCFRMKNDARLARRESKLELKISNLSLFDIITALDKSKYLKDRIDQKNGFYFLRDWNKDFFNHAIKTQKICAQKIKKTRRYINLIKYLPFVRAIFLSGSVAMGYASQKSDLDVLIVSEYDKIWLVRAMVVIVTFFFGVKRRSDEADDYKDKVCLNHFVTTESLEIPFQSIYTAQLYARLLPLYDEGDYFQKFFVKNKWLKNYLVNYELFFKEAGGVKGAKNKNTPIIKKAFEIVFEIVKLIFGGFIKKLQIWLIQRNPLTYKSGGRITYNDKMLEFHPNSKEREIIERYNNKVLKLNFDKSFYEHDSGLIK